MATTFKAVVYAHQRRQDGTYNVKIRVTHKRKSRYLPTNVTVESSQLTRSLKIKDHQVLDALDATIKKMRTAVTDLGYSALEMDVDQLVTAMRQKMNAEKRFELDFYQYGMDYAATVKPGTRRSYLGAFANVLRYSNGLHPDVNDINARWLRGYISFLQAKKLKPDTIEIYRSKLSKVHSLARLEFNDEDTGYIRIPGNPFDVVKAPAVVTSIRHRNLSVKYIQNLIDLEPDPRINSRRNIAQTMFLLSFCFQGMNLIDLWNAQEGPDGFVTFLRIKTQDSHPVKMVVRIEPEARKLFEPYDADGYLLGILRRKYKRYERIYECVSKGMKSLSEAIGKEFTFYSARHSWATIARNDCGIDKYTVHEALSHVDRATAIDDVYIAPDYSRFWKANREVLDRFEWHY